MSVAKLRGISHSVIDRLSNSGVLLRSLDVTMLSLANAGNPANLHAADSGTRPTAFHNKSSASVQQSSEFTVESLEISLGEAVERGQPMFQVSDYSQLLVQTVAFESDIELLRNLQKFEQSVAVEFGHNQDSDHGYEIRRDGLKISYIEQRIDKATQSLHMYLPLPNERVELPVQEENRKFTAWRFRPGQRAHVRVPVKTWNDVIVVPVGAMFEEGAETFVFRQHTHEEFDDVEHVEFETVPVRVLHKDQRFAVLADNNLSTSDRIVMNRAYQLHLALKVGKGSAGGHDHGHDH